MSSIPKITRVSTIILIFRILHELITTVYTYTNNINKKQMKINENVTIYKAGVQVCVLTLRSIHGLKQPTSRKINTT